MLRALSLPIAGALYLLCVRPGQAGARLGLRALAGLQLATYRGRPLRSLWLDTFDRRSAPIEHRFTWREIEPWFVEAGLKVRAAREDAGLIILAEREAPLLKYRSRSS